MAKHIIKEYVQCLKCETIFVWRTTKYTLFKCINTQEYEETCPSCSTSFTNNQLKKNKRKIFM